LTLRQLVDRKAFGSITEAEIHYDFERPSWIKYLSAKEYTPGAGIMFGLGRRATRCFFFFFGWSMSGSHTLDQALSLFGRPKSVTAFLKVLRGIDSEVEDTFTVVLQYDDPLLVTVKTTIVTCMQHQLKYFVRGTEGTYVKVRLSLSLWIRLTTQYGTDVQEEQTLAGKTYRDTDFAVNPVAEYGTLTTYEKFDDTQKYESTSKKWIGRFPTLNGDNSGYYQSLADTIRKGTPLQARPETSRDGIKLMELARISHNEGRTVSWS
jgi:predicted dehydrogenase